MSTFDDEPRTEFTEGNDEVAQDPASKTVGPYRLVQVIGEGGMGTVWLAEQEQPVRRQVALKLIKSGVNDKQVVARFEAERQALALMNHQNIAKVLDAGSTDAGQPYFVMELVRGIPITRYCDKNKLSINERLELFIPVCEAVQHAHQKGIIHRDIKPSNVLVCLYDGKPMAKVIDFGLAKALQHQMKLTDKTMFTEFGQVVGTLQYMSPEQAEMNQLDIDTRTDVYSLGVMLYELLTGSTPIDPQLLRKGAILRVLETIREHEPPRPSIRLSSVNNEIASDVSERRRIDPGKLRSILRGDLDWIVMKALEIDRVRRYETANGFALDVRRFLGGDPILARPPTAGYRLRKYVRKNRGVFTSLAVIAALICVGLVATTYLAISADRARRKARLAEIAATSAAEKESSLRREAESARERAAQEAARAQGAEATALAAQAKAEEQAQRAENIMDFVVSSFAGLDPRAGGKVELGAVRKDRTAKDVLDQTARQLLSNQVLPDDPLGKAQLMNRVGNVYRDFGDYDRSIELLTNADEIFRREIGVEAKVAIFNLRNLANVYLFKNPVESLPLYQECERLYRENYGTTSADYAILVGALGLSIQRSGNVEDAIPVIERAIMLSSESHGVDSREVLKQRLYLGSCLRRVGRETEGTSLHQQVYESASRLYGRDDWVTDWARNYLSGSLKADDRWEDALPLDRDRLEYQRSLFGDVHPRTIEAFKRLGVTYEKLGQTQEAWNVRSALFRNLKKKFGLNDPRTLTSFSLLVSMFEEGQFTGWNEYVESELIELKGKDLEAFTSSDIYLDALWFSAKQFESEEHFDEAARLYLQVVAHRDRNLGRNSPVALATSIRVARFLFEQDRTDELKQILADMPGEIDPEQLTITVREWDNDVSQATFAQLLKLEFDVVDLDVVIEGERVFKVVDFQPNWLPINQRTDFVIRTWTPVDEFEVENTEFLFQGYELKKKIAYEEQGESRVAALWQRVRRAPVWQTAADVPAVPDNVTSDERAMFDTIDSEVGEFLAEHQIPGLAIALARDGSTQYSKGFGWSEIETSTPVAPDARFRVASISKILTSVAVYQLVEEGKLSLDGAMVDHLPKECLPEQGVNDERINNITVQHLLSHSAGWSSASDPVFQTHEIAAELGVGLPIDNRDLIRFVLGRELDYAPGEASGYLNFGYQILGRIVEQASGLPYGEYVEQRILAPLGMNDTRQGSTLRKHQAEREVAYYSLRDAGRDADTDQLGLHSSDCYGGLFNLENLDACGGWITTTGDLMKLVDGVARQQSRDLLAESSWLAYFARPDSGYGSSWGRHYYANGWSVRPGTTGTTYWASGRFAGSCSFVAYFGEADDSFSSALLLNTDRSLRGESLSSSVDDFQYQLIRRLEALLERASE